MGILSTRENPPFPDFDRSCGVVLYTEINVKLKKKRVYIIKLNHYYTETILTIDRGFFFF